MREFRADRTVPLFVTLLVLAFLLMTFDVRTGGEGVLGALRAGANRMLEPAQRAGSAVVDPIGDFADGLADISTLRSENESLRARLSELQAELAAVGDKLERLQTLEVINDLELDIADLVTTNANVIGRTDSFDPSFRIDKGEGDGVLAGHPVLDEHGYLVGRVLEVWPGAALVVPIIGDVEAVTVTVGEQDGTLTSVVGSDEMVLEVFETAKPVSAGDQVVTSPFSISFPPSLPVGEIIESEEPQGQTLTARVRPFADFGRMRVVVVVAWPPDPAATTEDDAPVASIPVETTSAGEDQGG